MARRRPLQSKPCEIIRVGKRRYAAGLVWKPIKSSRNYLAEAKATGKADGMYARVIQRGSVQLQAGFAPKGDGVSGAYALAPSLMSVLGNEWVGVFALHGERYILMAVHGGAVLPGYDLTGNFEEINAALGQVYSLLSGESDFGEAGVIIAPSVFGVSEDTRDLSGLLAEVRVTPAMVLKPLSFGITPKQTVAVVVFVALVGAGVYAWSRWQIQLQREAAKVAAMAASQAAKSKADAPDNKPLPPPWLAQPGAEDVLAACRLAAQRVPLSVAGWRVSTYDCNAGAVTATYTRGETGASLLAFLDAAKAPNPDAPNPAATWSTSVDSAGTTATRVQALTPPPSKTTDALGSAQTLRDRVTDFSQQVEGFATLSLTQTPPPPPPADDPERQPPPWLEFATTITADVSPDVLADGLALDGLRITRVSASIAPSGTMKWNMTGVWYANR